MEKESNLSVIAFTVSMISITFCGLLSPISLILSIIALVKPDAYDRRKGLGYAAFVISLIELAFVLIALFYILLFIIATVLPSTNPVDYFESFDTMVMLCG